jgi:TonB family protein
MTRLIFFFAIAASAFGQNAPTRVSPDEAMKHILKQTEAVYPPLAEQTRISGTIILEVLIDSSGKTSVRRVISGHPLLITSAMNAVSSWKYQPFEVDGKPAPVITFVMVVFSLNGNQPPAVSPEMQFQHEFWSALESAQAALAKGDSTVAEKDLKSAENLLKPVSDGQRHLEERWQWTVEMGTLYLVQLKFDESEKYYKKALELHPVDDKDSLQVAVTQAHLANLYTEEKKYDLAHDSSSRSLAAYEKNFKRTDSHNAAARQVYGRGVAYQAWNLSKLASQRNDSAEFGKQCRKLLEFQDYLSAADHNPFVSACQTPISSPVPKN